MTKPYQPRNGNTERCRKLMRKFGRISKSELARLTGMTITQVCDTINALCKNKHARADGFVPGSGVGHPPAKYYVLTEKLPAECSPMERAESVHVVKPAGTWERKTAALLRPASPFDGLGK